MKRTFRKALCLFLSILLVIPSALSVFAFAETSSVIAAEYDGQKTIPVLEIERPTLPDGTISDTEYGYSEPLLHMTPGDGLWAEDNSGNAITTGLPNYVDLYVAQDDGALYLGIAVNQAAAHKDGVYTLDTFLGFGDTMTDGATTGFQLYPKSYSRGVTTCIETIVTSLGSSSGERLYSIDSAYEYPLPNWGSVKLQSDNTYTYIFEVELNLEDSVIASGKTWNEKPGAGYFSFDLGLFTGTERTGTLHFGAQDGENVIPHILNLAGGNADLSDLAISNGSDLTPAFDPSIKEYTAIVSPGQLPEVAATAADSGAKIEVLGLSDANMNLDHSIQVKVSPANGAPGKLYTINIVRNYDYEKIPATARTFASILEQIATTSWGAADAVEILLSGTVEDSSETLLGLNTVFKTNNTKLPIVIDGGGTAVLNLTAEKIASANDITFRNLTIPLGESAMEFYAGAGNVVFENVDFGTEEGKGNARFFGDTYTRSVFAGWTNKQLHLAKVGDTIPTSITFKGSTRYTPAQSVRLMMGAVGFDGEALEGTSAVAITSKRLSASFIIDGATVSFAGARAGTAPVAEASLTMLSGTAQALSVDGMTYSSSSAEQYQGNTSLTVSGGTVTGKNGITGVTTAVHTGNVYVTISQADEAVPTTVTSVNMSDRAEIRGSSYLSILGSTVQGDVVGSAASVTTYNTITNATVEGSFYGAATSARRIVNQLSGVTIKGNMIGGGFSGGIFRGITNTLANTTVEGSFTGGNRSANLYGKLTNSISGSTIGGKLVAGNENGSVSQPIRNTLLNTNAAGFFGGNLAGDVDGSITNTITGGTFTSTSFDANNPSSFTGGSGNGTVSGNIKNTVTGGTFKGDWGGASLLGTVKGDVVNEISGAVSFAGFMGGSSYVPAEGSEAVGATIEGSITNTLNAQGSNAPSFANRSGYGVGFFGGSRSGEILGSIHNTVSAGTFSSRYYGGSFNGSVGADENGVSITNLISGGSFNSGSGYYHSGGSMTATLAGDVVTTISGGTFNRHFAGGTRAMNNPDYTGTFRTTITGGTFKENVYGGTYGHNAEMQGYLTYASELTITGGTFEGNVYGGGKGNAPMSKGSTLTINGGVFKGDVHPGSETNTANQSQENNFSTLTIKMASASVPLEFYGTVSARDEKESVKILAVRDGRNIAMGPQAQMVVDEIETSVNSTEEGLGDYQSFIPVSTWTEGVTHVYLKKANIADDPNTEENEAVKYSSFIRLLGDLNNIEESTDENGYHLWIGAASGMATLTEGATYPVVPASITYTESVTNSASSQTEISYDASKLTAEKLEAIPLATNDMTTDERRALAVKYFQLQQSFSWTPNVTVNNYPSCNLSVEKHEDYNEKDLSFGNIYGGIPYQSIGTGNLYRWMEYYDETTGIFYLTDALYENGGFVIGDHTTDSWDAYAAYQEQLGITDQSQYKDIYHTGMKYFFNQCSVASFWGWARVINSANFIWTADMNVRNGFIPVGGFRYGYSLNADGTRIIPTADNYDSIEYQYDMTTMRRFGEIDETNPGFLSGSTQKAYDVKEVISDYNVTHTSQKGYTEAWYDIYAQVKPGDCLVNTGHAMMVVAVDPEKQIITVAEQIEGWGYAGSPVDREGDPDKKIMTENGEVTYLRQGQMMKDYTFKQLRSSNYIAFTFAEFQDPGKEDDPNVYDDADYLKFYNEVIVPETVNITGRYSLLTEATTGGMTLAEVQEMCGAGVEETQIILKYAKRDNTQDDKYDESVLTTFKPTNKSITYTQFRGLIISSNQTISDLFVTVTSPSGTTLLKRTSRSTQASVRTYYMNTTKDVQKSSMYSLLADLDGGKNTITIEAQLGTGEFVTVYSGILK